ncbi:aminotransferase class I/II-fold pyridoxal phosphate-dependent enzyme [Cohnella nanjingensis]|uniref:Aminotransferase class I/II-fold pyridoxal phosphate-dependent enzyme n=1 Tax=Cohnella nanjingensis TaxID=1387779 RepID=A0A7X0RWC5_9BACL|nr:aminotransferase class I/II-fold pyridoxal phosphate-dependent enzyme [Cohnella nanjingensis]MBB6674882.1 aminotransferase class I/II-fold pyridoxal phosphate-dependent enzyme [Cohnella nanjingensis]
MSNHNQAPLYEALARHAGQQAKPFHVPGHKQRSLRGNPEAARSYAPLLPLDVTELSDTDDLHHPSGPIAAAERLAADAFGAEETCFLVGGSTAGNLAMILGLCEPGDCILVQRNVHKSIIHGLALAGARAVFLPPEADSASGLAVAPSPETVRRALELYPEARAVVIASPNYYGMTADARGVAEAAHARHVPLLVDEAHGAHFGQHPAFPEAALRSGADAAVQSTHKMLTALTMGAMLHMQGERVQRGAIRQALRMVQSSSPSYPIMASLDLARQQLQAEGQALFEPALDAVRLVREALRELPFGALCAADPLKLSLYDMRGMRSGFELQEALERRGCLAEMADPRHVVLAFGPGSTPADGEALIEALRDMAGASSSSSAELSAVVCQPGQVRTNGHDDGKKEIDLREIPEPVIIQRHTGETEAIPLERAVGRVAGEWVIPYPPGIPILFPGESITERQAAQIKRWRDQGARFQGAADASFRSIRVTVEKRGRA